MMKTLLRVGNTLGAVALVAMLLGCSLSRPNLDALGISTAEPSVSVSSAGDPPPVTVTWLGVTTLLFDDGATQILTDGFFSRPGMFKVLLRRKVEPDVRAIEQALDDAGIGRLPSPPEERRLAAVLPVHSHYDHAFDSAEVARRTGAEVLGSASTANLARGAGLPEGQIREVEHGDSYPFGDFTVTFYESRHVPKSRRGDEPLFPGTIDVPLEPPAPVGAWRMGDAYSIVIAHPSGTALVQGSPGFVESALEEVQADVVFLAVGLLSRHGASYARALWRETVGATSAQRVFAIHFDDFVTCPYGKICPLPRCVDDVTASLEWLQQAASEQQPPLKVEFLPFGEKVALY